MKLSLIPYRLEHIKPFKIAHGERNYTDTLIVKVENDGITGFGEASHVPYYGYSLQDSINVIETFWPKIAPHFGKDPSEFWELLNVHFGENNFAKSAVDIAHYDWLSKKNEKPLWEYLGLTLKKLPLSSFTIGIDKLEEMGKALKDSDFPIFKIKLGSGNDWEILNYLRSISDKPFRVDVNGGWSLSESLANLPKLEELKLEFLEQPLPKNNLEENTILKGIAEIPIFADESCCSMKDLQDCYENFDGINIKLSKCGGIYPSLQMAQEARRLGMKVMIGCMTESSIGISAIAHLSSLVDYVDLDGAMLIKNDPSDGVLLEKGKAIFNGRNGHGAILNEV